MSPHFSVLAPQFLMKCQGPYCSPRGSVLPPCSRLLGATLSLTHCLTATLASLFCQHASHFPHPGLCSGCSFCLECSSPDVHLPHSCLSSGSFLQCHLNELFPGFSLQLSVWAFPFPFTSLMFPYEAYSYGTSKEVLRGQGVGLSRSLSLLHP